MEQLEDFLVEIEQIEDINDIELPGGGSGFGCTCAGASLDKITV